MKIIPESELLSLIGKTEEEQLRYLRGVCLNVIKVSVVCEVCKKDLPKAIVKEESLADLAERLWEKANIKIIHPMATIYEHLSGILVTQETRAAFVEWWAWSAKPIHRIIAAIIAMQRAGVEI